MQSVRQSTRDRTWLLSPDPTPKRLRVRPPLLPVFPVVSQSNFHPVVATLLSFAIGFSPIGALSLTILGLCTLQTGSYLMVAPALLIAVTASYLNPAFGRVAVRGFFYGILAVFVYDCVRMPFVVAGVWGDFIPKIGGLLLGQSSPNWVIGYLWRYIGNGGGMGLTFTVSFVMLRISMDSRVVGILFGIGIWSCLLATIAASPMGEEMLFRITPLSFILSFVGHFVYGGVLGLCLLRRKRVSRTISFSRLVQRPRLTIR